MPEIGADEHSVIPRRHAGVGVAACASVGGCAVLTVLAAAVALTLPSLLPRKESPPNMRRCSSNLKQLASAILLYSQDYDDRLPPSATWRTEIFPYVKNPDIFMCPPRPRVSSGYAYNQRLDRLPVKRMTTPAATPEVFDSSLGYPNAADQLQSFAAPHNGKGNVAFADGHVKAAAAAPPMPALKRASK